MGVKTNRTSFLRGNRSGYNNTELKTWRDVIWQHEQHEPHVNKYNKERTHVRRKGKQFLHHMWHPSCYLNLCLSVMLNSVSCSFTPINVLTNAHSFNSDLLYYSNLSHMHVTIREHLCLPPVFLVGSVMFICFVSVVYRA